VDWESAVHTIVEEEIRVEPYPCRSSIRSSIEAGDDIARE